MGMVLLTIAGCDFFKLLSGELYRWEKLGCRLYEVGRALLECGMSIPYDIDSEKS
ncbi:hypothetical protein MF1_02750 [Bartonella quintana]|nr:hypothetical protein MF1_02750 [Bartonella quintana]